MIDINVGILQFAGHFIQGRKHFGVVGIGKNQLIGVHVSVVLQVHVFVARSRLMQVLVGLVAIQLCFHHCRGLTFDLVQQRLNHLVEVKEFSDSVVVLFFLH